MFLRAGEPGKALAEFEAALRTNPQQTEWLAEAARVAFEDGDYLKAETYFSRANQENPTDEIHASLVLVRDILGNDPFLAALSDEEQARRTRRDFAQGLERIGKCMDSAVSGSSLAQPSSDLAAMNKEAQDLQARVNLPSLSQAPEIRNQAMQLVFQIEDATAQTCGPPVGMDQALMLVAKRRAGSNP
jgi:tetratricopeptide (TPR) repeat protein